MNFTNSYNLDLVKNKTMFSHTPFFSGDILIRDHIQKLAQRSRTKVLIITDAMHLYENMPDLNIDVMGISQLQSKDLNENLIFELEDYLSETGLIFVRVFDENLYREEIDAINSLYDKSSGMFFLQVSSEGVKALKHAEEFDLESSMYIEDEQIFD